MPQRPKKNKFKGLYLLDAPFKTVFSCPPPPHPPPPCQIPSKIIDTLDPRDIENIEHLPPTSPPPPKTKN